jgi:hypothetical protein
MNSQPWAPGFSLNVSWERIRTGVARPTRATPHTRHFFGSSEKAAQGEVSTPGRYDPFSPAFILELDVCGKI